MSDTTKNMAQNSPENKPEEKTKPDEKLAPAPGGDKRDAQPDKSKAK